MTDLHRFLTQAANLAGSTIDEIVARVMHVDDSASPATRVFTDDSIRELVRSLDWELRIRNPGLQYVLRTMYIGYRREGLSVSTAGERSQVFVSIIKSNTRLEVILPVDPDRFSDKANASDLRGKGHHGVGEVRVLIKDQSDLAQFLTDFAEWLMPQDPSSRP